MYTGDLEGAHQILEEEYYAASSTLATLRLFELTLARYLLTLIPPPDLVERLSPGLLLPHDFSAAQLNATILPALTIETTLGITWSTQPTPSPSSSSRGSARDKDGSTGLQGLLH